jgi:23S rRNA (guanosine2251-2'-O)-methyltransferase
LTGAKKFVLKQFRSQQRPKKSTLVIGPQQVIEAMESGKPLDRIYLFQKIQHDIFGRIRQLASHHGVPVNLVPLEKLNSFNISEHSGCVAVISKVVYQDLQQVISWVVERGEAPLLLILDGITDIRNIGGIARTAFCTGVHAIIIPDKGVGALNEDAILTSAGALEKLTVCRVSSLMKAVDTLHLNGIKVYASEMKAEPRLDKIDWKEPAAIVMGSEDKGIHSALKKICDLSFSIPMKGAFESLNVSVATGMILYEVMMQRNNQK